MSDPANARQNERHAALFTSLIFQWSELGLMLLGHGPREDNAGPDVDLEHAQMVVDQLEMLQAKTRGNLTDAESTLLKRSLMNLRMAFVEAVEKTPIPSNPGSGVAEVPAPTAPATPSAPSPEPLAATPAADQPAVEPEESKVRYSKKY